MAVVQTAEESNDPQEQGGGARGWRWLLEMHRFDFEKIKTKNFRKKAKGVVVDVVEWWIYSEGMIDVVIGQKSNKNVT
jgi:hypothetical protein